MQKITDKKSFSIYLFVALVVLYLAMIIPMISRVGISFDEQTDLIIAQSYSSADLGWLRGIDLDSTNVRLPMYVSKLFFNLTDNELYSARLVSVLMGILTLLAVYLYCRREFNETTGLVACAIIAISPYFLAFSKVAFTEGDSFITCFTLWLLFSVTSLKKESNLLWILVTGLSLGLALSAKASATVLVAATIFYLLLPDASSGVFTGGSRLPIKQIFYYLMAMTVVLVVVFAGWVFSGAATIQELPSAYGELSKDQLIAHYFTAFIFWALIIYSFYTKRAFQVGYGWNLLLVLALAAITFFIIPPVHTTNPAVFGALVDIFISSTDSFTWLFAGEAATLHFFDLLLKSGLVVGIGLWLSIIVACFQWRKRPALRAPLLFFLAYFAFLVFKMPHAQTFFMMPLLPIAAILLADRFGWLLKRSPRIAWVLLGCAVLSTGGDLILTYPHTQLNGYQWVGARYLAGRSTIGYRSIAQTPSDGLEQAAQWLCDNVAPGQRVLHYMRADHILQARLRNSGIASRNGFSRHADLDQANYVLIHINALLDDGRGKDNPTGSVYKYPFDKAELERDFRKIYSEKRPFGIEVASIWFRRIPYDIDQSGNIIGSGTEREGLNRHRGVD